MVTVTRSLVFSRSSHEELQNNPASGLEYVETLLTEITADVLRLDHEDFDSNRSFLSLGGDSITAIKMMARCKAKGVTLNIVDMIDTKSIKELSQRAYQQSPGLHTITEESHVIKEPNESRKLSHLQKLYAENSNTEARVFHLGTTTSYNNLHVALSTLVEQHPMLHAQLARTEKNDWVFQDQQTAPKSFMLELHALDTTEELVDVVMKLRTRLCRLQAPLFGGIIFEMASGSRLLALAAHSAIVDLTSWEIIAKELASHLGDHKNLALHSRYFHEWILEPIRDAKRELSANFQYLKKQSEDDQPRLVDPAPTAALPKSELLEAKHLVIDETDILLLISQFGDQGDKINSRTISFIHSALVNAVSITTSLDAEDILFCDIHEDRSGMRLDNNLDTIGCFDKISQWSTRLSKSDDDSQLLERVGGWDQGMFGSCVNGELQRHSGQLTPPSESTTTTIIVDARQFKDHSLESHESFSQVEPNLWLPEIHDGDAPHLSISLFPTPNTINCSFRGDAKWHETYNLEDFVNVFKAALSGILRRLRHKRNIATTKISPSSISKPQVQSQDAFDPYSFKSLVNSIQPILPCSPVQEGFLISQSTNPQLYQCCFVVKFTGHHLSAQQFALSWQEVVRRHTILRTLFISSSTRPGQFDQVVVGNFVPSIEIHNWTQLPSLRPFDSRNFVPFLPSTVPHRIHLTQASNDEVHLKLEISHALVDGQSTDVIIRDLCAAYHGTQVSTPALPYGDFVAYQAQLPVEASQAYWTKYLKDAQPTLLPMDRGHESLSNIDTLNTKLEFGEGLISEFCNLHSVTFSNICQVAWGLVLRLLTGSNNVTFSYGTSGRSAPLEDLQNAVGPFVGTLICNINFNTTTPMEDILKKVSKDYFEGFLYPYTQDPSNTAASGKSALQLGNTTMSFQRVLDATVSTESGIQVSVIEKSRPTDYDVAVYIEAERDALTIDLDFWRSRMNLESAKVVLKVFSQAIRCVLQTPRGTAMDINLLGAEDRTTLYRWNNEIPNAVKYCLHEKVQEISKQQPDALAICAWDGNLTYDELITKSTTLAHQLIRLGVAPESMVGLCMDKSKWAVISMLAILQAGGVVVPLGNSHPLTRINGILSDTEAKIILVDQQQAERLAQLDHKSLFLTVDAVLLASLPPNASSPASGVTPTNTAWVIFTSGSTGTPKGVLLQHKALSTSVKVHGDAFGINHATRAAQFAAYTFDVSISDIFSTLHHGGCICIFSEESRMSRLTESLQEFKVNYVNLTPTVLRLLDPANTPLIKTAVVGGEPLDPKLVQMWAPHARVINSYGPSECSIISTCYSVSDPAEASIVGFPTATRLWVAETANPNRLCPIGVPGELLIDGPLLSRGYLNDATKTANSFVTNPSFAADLGLPTNLRFYRTGDLVRQNEDGSLTHLGRRDLQVKIRGQRVEIGEIEHWVASLLKDTKLVAVLITNQGQQNQQIGLSAVVEFNKESIHFNDQVNGSFLPPSSDLRKTFDELRSSLFKVLPAYMVPTVYLPVSQMPLNPSGKLDRQAAKQLIEAVDTKLLQQYINTEKASISSENERNLQLLWSKVLGISKENIGAHDHFLQIGGDSVAAIRIVSAIRQSGLRMNMTVADIFQHPRLSDLAKVLDNRASKTGIMLEQMDTAPFDLWKKSSKMQPEQLEEQLQQIAEQCEVSRDQIEDVYPCTPLQEGMMAITARQPTAYVSCQVFSLAEEVDVTRFQAAWQKVAQSVSILRSRILFRPQSASLQVVIRNISPWKQDSSLDNYLKESRATIIGPGKPLNEFALVREASGNRFFVWTAHHSTYDGWSRNLIFEKVANLYNNNRTPDSVPYTRFINYLLQAEPVAVEKYWLDQFHGEPAANFPDLPHPNYHARPRHQIKYEIGLPKFETLDVVMPDVLRAAWALVVSQHAGTHDPVFAVALSGRDAPVADIADLVAPTITTVPVRIHVDDTQSVKDFLDCIRQQRIGMIEYQHTGLQLIRKLVPGQESALDLRHMLVVQPAAQSDGSLGIPGMVEVPVDMEEFDSYGLNLECSLSSNLATVDVRYDDKVITESQIVRMLDQFALVIKQLCDPAMFQRQVGDIEHLSQKDLQLIKSWNSKLPSAVKICLHQQVTKMANSQPYAPAVCAWDGNLNYSELHTQAATLSHHLLQEDSSIGPETKIGICMDKSKFAIVSMLAILQTGAAVVPLGVSHPLARIKQIMADTAAPMILVDQAQKKRLQGLTVNFVTVNATLLNSLELKSQRPSSRVTPDNAAWVIFTSGSTGIPKGVVLEHKALASSIQAHGRVFGLGPKSRVYQFAAYTFDAAIQDCFSTLIWGGTICISSENERMNNLATAMASMDVNFVGLTSTVARLIQPSEVPSLKTLVLFGEPVQAGVVETWCKHADVLNAYGPSECSIHSTCNGPIKDPSQASNIGYGMGTRTWVVQPSNPNQLCPIGVTGELLIEGPQLARGYLNDDGKTAAAFITDPAFASNPELGLSLGCRVYRSGDLVRQNEDGSLTCLGRRDTQYKLRGQRVDIGEIEFWITKSQPSAQSAAVVITNRGQDQDQQMLVAIIEVASGNNNSHSLDDLLPYSDNLRQSFDSLRTSLFEVLPAYMVPAIYIPVSRLPQNLSGKLDRRATLSFIKSISTSTLLSYTSNTTTSKVTPSTEIGIQLQELWTQVLGTDVKIGAHDNFFQIGGDSIIAMRVVAAARERGLRITVADIFIYPKLEDLANFLEGKGGKEDIEEVQEVESVPFEMWREAIGFEFSAGRLVSGKAAQGDPLSDTALLEEFQKHADKWNRVPTALVSGSDRIVDSVKRAFDKYYKDNESPADIWIAFIEIPSTIKETTTRIYSARELAEKCELPKPNKFSHEVVFE